MTALTGFKSGKNKVRSNGFKGTLSFIHRIIQSKSTEDPFMFSLFYSPALL